MSAAKIITVIGATGNQGGSVARSLLQNVEFKVRAVTRNPNSEASQKLATLGAEVAQADGFNSDEILAAFQGSWGAFVNLNSDDKGLTNPDGPNEFDLGKSIIDAAAAAGVQHLAFSSGPNCTELTNGKVNMKAMNSKYQIEQYAKQLGSFQSVVPVGAGWFLENFLAKEVAPVFGGFPHFPDNEGILTFRTPNWGGEENVPWLSVTEDFGDIIHGIFLSPEKWNNRFVHGVSDPGSFQYLVKSFEAATGRKSRFEPVLPTWEAFDTHNISELEDVKLMFGFAQETGGRYFSEPTEKETARELKRATAVALGRSAEQQELISVKEWFEARFVLV
ncbi:NmrA/HSCARG family protein [Aspergillus ruber CBS 135680]|uniref:NAD(P)-binding protein n=1 Tax=Aspergillus ruber (strain CBS 135680) TaxID=1388766 RepID=A0A017SL70_ASPRC|nr:NAD(P)-binding protein [Aspergillus ruber CBS 135680]EYE97682.1 NAD(P)-binding protein [Aspergillus ruber CBS 135680]